jgi:hypothetical protein
MSYLLLWMCKFHIEQIDYNHLSWYPSEDLPSYDKENEVDWVPEEIDDEVSLSTAFVEC